jgi:oligopeptide/dipeptide ABC transporter ATP-binding protein
VQDVVQNPLHPYAKGLMGAIPTLAGDAPRLVQIPGSMPRLSAIPPGCSFNPRCASVFDRCRVDRPEPLLHGTQSVACHLYDTAPGERAKETAARRRAIDLLAEVGIPAPDKRIDAYPHEFSGGMRQRVVIALAICAEPELIIADEPTTALDVSVQAQIISLIKRLGRDHGTAVMLVTHDMGVIAETSDRVAVMYSGRIAEIGPVQDVVQNPLHPYAKGLMGAIPTLVGDARRLVQIPGSMPRLSAIPPGCPFNPRCAFVFDRCRIERPEPIRQGAQSVACHLYDATAKNTPKDTAA